MYPCTNLHSLYKLILHSLYKFALLVQICTPCTKFYSFASLHSLCKFALLYKFSLFVWICIPCAQMHFPLLNVILSFFSPFAGEFAVACFKTGRNGIVVYRDPDIGATIAGGPDGCSSGLYLEGHHLVRPTSPWTGNSSRMAVLINTLVTCAKAATR